MAKKVRTVKAREIRGRKVLKGKVYEYTYYTLPLNIYIRKSVIEKWGPEFVVETDPDQGIVVVKPKKLAEGEGK
jgi:hypothetical protein